MKRTRAGQARSPATLDAARETRGQPPEGGSFPIVGIGASAGGLEAFTTLLKHLPLDTGMGFVLVQHLDPEHDSALTQLLGRATLLPVHEVTNRLRVEANHVYVIPRNTNLGIVEGMLTLRPRPKTRAPHRSIDFFLEALAADQRERAIGVILSGTATDGTLGLEAIKAEGGITFAQDDSARYDSMPRSAVAAGCVDFVLSPEDIANELARIAKHPYVAGTGGDGLTRAAPSTGSGSPRAKSRGEGDRALATAYAGDDVPLPSGGHGAPPTGANQARAEAEAGRGTTAADKATEEGFKKILLLVRNHSGVDFSLYKSSTIQRRITRRLVLGKHHTLDQYARFLRGNTKELDALYSDTLISVTSFFRNPDAFDVIQRKVLPTLLQQRGDDPLRVWVLGCSTGQEAYSLAMAFVEASDKAPRTRRLQVFATDLNDALLDMARHGLYAKSVAEDLSPERLRRFFVEEEGGYRVTKSLREMVVFARQNVITDPPFSRMDIISCRNLLIYFEPGLQTKVLPVFHYALKPGGFLYLGASESIGRFTELFEPVDKKHRIYAKKAAATPAFQLPARKGLREPSAPGRPARNRLEAPAGPGGVVDGFRAELSAQREADRVSVNQFAPPAVLVNAELQILQFRGPTGAYLEPPSGKASFDVLKMARNGLMLPLRTAINKAKRDNKTARKDNVRVEQDGTNRMVHLEVIPLKNLRERCFLIVFEDAATEATTSSARQAPGGRRRALEPPLHAGRSRRPSESRRLAGLETELAETRDYLQSIQEQHEAANEELQASNEEVQSANEELQSINEELETSKEELESANEELTTVNEEMANRNTELNRLNSDLVNIQTSAQVAMVLLARNLTIRRFSAQAERQLNLLATDVGRPIGHVRHPLDVPDLDAFITGVIDTVRAREREVQDKDGRWYSLRVRPYLTLDNKVDGAVLVLVDIDSLKRTAHALTAARDYAESIIETVREPLVVLDTDLRVTSVNRSFCKTFRVTSPETVGQFVYDLGNRQWNIPELRTLLEEVLVQNHTIEDFPVQHDFQHLGRRTMLLNARRMRNPAEKAERILLSIEDITERKAAEVALRESEERYRTLFASIDEGFCVIEKVEGGAGERLDFRYIEANPAFAVHAGVSGVVGKTIRQAFPGEPEEWFLTYDTIVRTGEPMQFERGLVTQGRVLELYAFRVDDETRRRVAVIFKDITARKEAEEGRARLSAIVESSDDAIISKDLNGVITSWNAGAQRLFGYTAEDAVGQPVTLLIPPDRLDEEPVVLAHIHRGEVIEHYETVRRRKDGTLVDVSLTVSPIFDSQRRVVGASKIARDITEQKKVAERLLEADRHKNEFLAMLAHELRNPLAPILVSTEILRRANRLEETEGATHLDLSQRVDHALDVLQRQAGQMVRLVDDLLDAGRISRGKIDLRRDRVEVASVVHHAVEAAQPLFERRGQKLTVTLPTAPVYVNADPTRLAQIVGNLLNNACKFTARDGRIWLTVEVESSGPDEGASQPLAPQVVVRVRDTGVGIAADRLEGIFDMFTQVDTSLERSTTGLGIGLTLVKTLAEMHGGAVEASSPGIGHGSEFVVRLPIVVETGTPALQPATTGPAATPLRVLVVDDNQDAAESLAMLLEFNGHETHTAHDGLAAVEATATFRPDVILLDIGLPGLNGYEVARRIREQRSGEGRPVLVALTGWGQDEDRRRSEEAGFDAHIVKPVDNVVLGKLLAAAGARNQEVEP